MAVTLDDVAYLLDILITSRLIEQEDQTYEYDIFLLENELGFTTQEAMKEVKDQRGLYVSYTHLKRCYESMLNRCNQLEEPASDEEEEEQSVVRTTCIKDLDRLGDWSWGGMTLSFLYELFCLTSDSVVKATGGYMTLLVDEF
ncbi:hypothetical protein MtrunA17_Chr2g0297371 [Medicago truncatula]|uniref:Uncharacterized protein n=1 Tax=Medicago truncatula TaxID=3880 RepID=A0A396JA95_MEDTR|nr:hypothetical protein MtrunA17_Chr2g0297371 [Medicago truncatula]